MLVFDVYLINLDNDGAFLQKNVHKTQNLDFKGE